MPDKQGTYVQSVAIGQLRVKHVVTAAASGADLQELLDLSAKRRAAGVLI